MDRGWIKLWRKSLDSGIIQNHKAWAAWTYFLMKATHKRTTAVIGNQTITLEPGQLIVGREKTSKELGMSEQNFRTTVRFLEKLGNLTSKPTNKFTVITIVNWDTYQSEESEINQQTNQHLTSNQPATNHIQEHKNVKNIKNNNTKYIQKTSKTPPIADKTNI